MSTSTSTSSATATPTASSSSDNPYADFQYYYYDPSMAAAVIFIILFTLTTCAHLFQLIQRRTWYFIPVVIGGLFEVIGYIGRALSAHETPNWTLGPYIMQSLLLLLAPALLAASVYMVLGRLIRALDTDTNASGTAKRLSPIPTRWLTPTFVTGDVLSFLVQGGGGGMMSQAKTAADSKRGSNVVLAGLVIQLICFGLFVVVAGVVHLRAGRRLRSRTTTTAIPWRRLLLVLYAVSALIMVRSVFRVVEYGQGQRGYLLSHEAFLYVFDGLLMWIAMCLFNVWHPSRLLNATDVQLCRVSQEELGFRAEGERPDSGPYTMDEWTAYRQRGQGQGQEESKPPGWRQEEYTAYGA